MKREFTRQRSKKRQQTQISIVPSSDRRSKSAGQLDPQEGEHCYIQDQCVRINTQISISSINICQRIQ